MSTKLNIGAIVKDHFGTMRSYRTQKLSFFDGITFIVLPALVAIVISIHYKAPESAFATSIITASSIFIGLLLNLLVLLYQISYRNREKLLASPGNDHLTRKKLLLKEINANISYCILLLSVLVVSCITMAFEEQMGEISIKIGYGLVYFLSIHFILNLIMILKRVYALISIEHNK